MHRARKSRVTRAATYLVFSILITANIVFIATQFGITRYPSQATALLRDGEMGEGRALWKKEMEERSTALTVPSVSCDLCPASDDFCMELGSVLSLFSLDVASDAFVSRYHNIAQSIAYEGTSHVSHVQQSDRHTSSFP